MQFFDTIRLIHAAASIGLARDVSRRKADLKIEVLAGRRPFRLDRHQCRAYLNITNSTRSDPFCYVMTINATLHKAHIEVVFLRAGGIYSRSIRHYWIPISIIEADVGWCFIVSRYLKRLAHEIIEILA